MDATKTKKAIRSLLTLHQQMLNDGGVWIYSKQYESFLIQRRMLLKNRFHLEYTQENIAILFKFPMTTAIDLFEPVDDALCRFRACVIVRLWNCRVDKDNILARRAGESWTIEEQVDFVYNALVKKACEV